MAGLESNFEAIWQSILLELNNAAKSSHHDWHLMTLASISPDGFPEARTVVLREFESEKVALWFHTDYRSPKVIGLKIGDGDVELVLYSKTLRRQLRCRAKAILHHNDQRARMRWNESKDTSRRCYLAQTPPSEAVAHNHSVLPDEVVDKVPCIKQAEAGFVNFAAIECRISSIDILQLNAQGGERAKLYFEKGHFSKGEWLAP